MSAAFDGPVRLGLRTGPGVVWGIESGDLNVNEVAWPAAGGVGPHRNDALDVLIVVLAGSATLHVDGRDHPLGVHDAALVPAGAMRSITAGDEGVRYLTCHRRRARTGLAVVRSAAP